MDLLLDNARKATTAKARTTLYRAAFRILRSQLPLIYLCHPVNRDGVDKNVRACEIYGDGLIRAILRPVRDARKSSDDHGRLHPAQGRSRPDRRLPREHPRLRRRARDPGRPRARVAARSARPRAAGRRSARSTGSTSRCRCSTCAGSGSRSRATSGRDSRGLPVARTIVTRLPLTLELAGLSILIGARARDHGRRDRRRAPRQGRPTTRPTTVALLGLSVPHFWLGLLMILAFAVNLDWLPAGGYVSFREDPVGNLEPHAHARRSCSARACRPC